MRSPCSSRTQVSSDPQIDSSHSGNTPRSRARRSDSTFDSSSMKRMSSLPSSVERGDPYGSPSFTSMSAHPMIPRPMRRMFFDRSSIAGRGYWLASITLSRKWVALWTAVRRPSQSIRPSSTKAPTFTEPRLHTSYGSRGCSPHGLVASYDPMRGTGLYRLASSTKNTPGSPFRHAPYTILSNTARASSCPTGFPLRGFRRSYGSSRFNAAMKSSVTATEMLKFVILFLSSLQSMNSRMSG